MPANNVRNGGIWGALGRQRTSGTARGAPDDAAFEALFLRHYGLVYGIARRLLRAPEEIEDAVQEVFLRLYRQERLPPDDDGARRWLARVTTNVALNMLRSDQRQLARLQRNALLGRAEESGQAEQLDPANAALAREEAALVEQALAQMAERARACLLLRSGGFAYTEIAAALEVAPGSVGTILARAEREFRRRYLALAEGSAELATPAAQQSGMTKPAMTYVKPLIRQS